jgi:ABC-type transporter Mla subunit MlaD
MRRRTPLEALAASPTMIGAITTLVVVVAVFLAYNANQGLPFVPTYRVAVEVPNASRLVNNNEVRVGGNRVGVVESIEAVRPDSETAQAADSDATAADDEGRGAGEVIARLNLRLDKAVEPLPKNSVFRVRYRSAFGLKYLEVTRGDSEGAPEGFIFDATDDRDDPDDEDNLILSLEEARENPGADNGTFIEQTEFDDIANTFDQRTRNAGRLNLQGYGDAFAARGTSLNLAIESLNPLFSNLEPVMRELARPNTQFRRFFPALAETAAIVAPVATQQAELFTNMADTFAAISADPGALQETISEGPPTLETGIRTMPDQQIFLAEFTDLSERLRPGVRQLRLALPSLNSAVRIGTPVLRRTPVLNRRLRSVFAELNQLVRQPSTLLSLQRLERTFRRARPLASWVVPAQTVCNYWNYWTTFLPEHLTERDSVGYTQRVSVIDTPPGSLTVDAQVGGVPIGEFTVPGEVETGLSLGGYTGVQANGRYGEAAPPPHTPGEFDPHHLPILHGNPAGPTGQRNADCQSGQTGYILGDLRLPGQPRHNPAVGVPNIPGTRGPTTIFFDRDGNRRLVDTRVEARQP